MESGLSRGGLTGAVCTMLGARQGSIDALGQRQKLAGLVAEHGLKLLSQGL
jgi:hypothetical protein